MAPFQGLPTCFLFAIFEVFLVLTIKPTPLHLLGKTTTPGYTPVHTSEYTFPVNLLFTTTTCSLRSQVRRLKPLHC